MLIQKKNILEKEVAELKADHETRRRRTPTAPRRRLLQVQAEIKKLKAEKDSMLAKMAQRAGARPDPGPARRPVGRRRGQGARQRARRTSRHTIAEANLGEELAEIVARRAPAELRAKIRRRHARKPAGRDEAASSPPRRPRRRRCERGRTQESPAPGLKAPRAATSTPGRSCAPHPPWAEELRRRYLAGEASQFVLHGNVFDLSTRRRPLAGTRVPDRRCWPTTRTSWSSSMCRRAVKWSTARATGLRRAAARRSPTGKFLPAHGAVS